ncbi:MAG TPA: CaiB/BaiF CoA-transferase family protein [Deferrisomatales bacterium]|nr:CaiB/BaiF CoA-transferase family protein [Deferrisomatales bacterium]
MGPLTGVRVIEMAGIGPGPFCAMMLADMGAEVLRVERKPAPGVDAAPLHPVFNPGRAGVLHRGRRSVALDLKAPGAVDAVLRLVEGADALIEGFRPGVMERLGLGPEVCEQRNPRLVFGRMTGWGQHGPLAHAAGHDIDYIAISGALHAIGEAGRAPVPPLNLVGDFGGGGMLLAFGVVCALLEARTSGRGQVVDAAMCDGAAILMAMLYGFRGMGQWSDTRGSNLLDGGAPFYGTYRCADGGYLAVGPIEPQFYAELLRRCGVDDPDLIDPSDPAGWPRQREKLSAVFATRSRDEWCERLEGSDACVVPVLGLADAPDHPHNRARGTFGELEGVVQPAPAPRFSRTPGEIQSPPPLTGEHTEAALGDWGLSAGEIGSLKDHGAI